jgi:hypothetical protein
MLGPPRRQARRRKRLRDHGSGYGDTARGVGTGRSGWRRDERGELVGDDLITASCERPSRPDARGSCSTVSTRSRATALDEIADRGPSSASNQVPDKTGPAVVAAVARDRCQRRRVREAGGASSANTEPPHCDRMGGAVGRFERWCASGVVYWCDTAMTDYSSRPTFRLDKATPEQVRRRVGGGVALAGVAAK